MIAAASRSRLFRSIFLTAASLSISACSTIDKVDNYLSSQAKSRPPVDSSSGAQRPPAKPTTPAAPSDEPRETIIGYFAGLEKENSALANGAFYPETVLFIVNGRVISEADSNAEIQVVPESLLEVKVFNGGTQSLDRAEIGFYAEGARYLDLGAWEMQEGSAWYYCRAPINPSSPKAEPLAYFTTANSFKLAMRSGRRVPAVVRLKSFNKPEIARKFFLKVY